MNAFLTAVAFLVLVAVAAYVIHHQLGLQRTDRIAAFRYSAPRPGRRGAPRPHPAPRVGIRASDRPPGPTAHRPAATRARGVDAGSGAPEVPSIRTEAS